MRLTCYVARAKNGRQELNTLDIREDWELVEMLVWEEQPEPEAWVEDGQETKEEDDWELVEITNVYLDEE
jgi:hypothetical protein